MKIAKIIRQGESQAVYLPKEFQIEGDKVFIKKLGNAIVLLSMADPWEPLFNSLDKFSDDFMESRD